MRDELKKRQFIYGFDRSDDGTCAVEIECCPDGVYRVTEVRYRPAPC